MAVKEYKETHLWKWFSIYIRLRDSDENGFVTCFTCGNIRFWKQCDAGHGIGRQHRGTKYSEQNNHGQCKHCNGFEGGMREIYREKMDEKYGPGTWDRMNLMSKKLIKFGKFEIHHLTVHYMNEAKKLLNQKGLTL